MPDTMCTGMCTPHTCTCHAITHVQMEDAFLAALKLKPDGGHARTLRRRLAAVQKEVE